MRLSLLVGALCALALATPAYAQAGGMGGGMEGMGGGRGLRQRGDRPMMPTDEQIDGPPTPETMHQLLSLDETQLARYRHGYDSLMAESRAERDSAHAAVKALRDGFGSASRDAARARAGDMHRISEDLAKRDDTFDHSLKTILTKGQQKQYDKWKDQNRKDAEEKQRDEIRARMSGGGRRSGGVPSF